MGMVRQPRGKAVATYSPTGPVPPARVAQLALRPMFLFSCANAVAENVALAVAEHCQTWLRCVDWSDEHGAAEIGRLRRGVVGVVGRKRGAPQSGCVGVVAGDGVIAAMTSSNPAAPSAAVRSRAPRSGTLTLLSSTLCHSCSNRP